VGQESPACPNAPSGGKINSIRLCNNYQLIKVPIPAPRYSLLRSKAVVRELVDGSWNFNFLIGWWRAVKKRVARMTDSYQLIFYFKVYTIQNIAESLNIKIFGFS
jgi:hypothetical protein